MMKNPSHPGEIILEDTLPAYGHTIASAARVLGITRANLDRVLKGKASLSHELALKIEKAFGVSAELMTAVQNNYDLAQARKRADEITAGIERQKLAA